LDAGISVQREDEDIAERPGALEQTNVAGMQNVITAIRKYDFLGFRFPGAPLREKFGTSVELAHSLFYFTIARKKDLSFCNSLADIYRCCQEKLSWRDGAGFWGWW
jgi:hypothetical protein